MLSFGFEPVQPTEWARLTVRHYGLESIISVFSYTKDGFEPPFIHAGNRTPPTSLPLLGRLRPSDFVYVKTEFRMYFYILNKGTYGHIRQLRSSVFQFHHRISSRNTRSKLSKSGLVSFISQLYTDSPILSTKTKKAQVFYSWAALR